MTVLQIEGFSGIAPRWSARLLRQNQAVQSQNAKLLSGELRGFHATEILYDFNPLNLSYPIARAFRLPASVATPIPINGSDQWIGFKDSTVDFVRTPVLEDSFERYYWSGDSLNHSGAPVYNTRARINAGNSGANAPYLLGIPAPIDAPSVTAPAGSTETRAYTYTFVSAYGEEGAPAPATTVSGALGTWNITGMDTTVTNPSFYNLSLTRIYRTVGTTGTYFHVADVAFGTSSYADSAADSTVGLNFTMPSLFYFTPPSTLQGLVAHPGGFLVGFSGRDVWMSQPYQPHAWPPQNVQTCQTEVVGLAIFNNTIIVMTTSHPYFGEGMSPENVTLQKMDAVEPCVSRRSIATTVDGVYYASPQGIILNNGAYTQLVTRQLFTREEWQEFFSPTTVYAVPYGVEYIAFDTTSTGFIFSPSDPTTPLSQMDYFTNVEAIQQDPYSGDAYLVTNSQVRLWDPPDSIPLSYTWQSKQFDLPKPVNFGAIRLKFNAGTIVVSQSQLAEYQTYNNYRILKPLNPLNACPINGVRTLAYPGFPPVQEGGQNYQPPPENQTPIAGSSMYIMSEFEDINAGATVIIQARDLETSAWVTVFSQTLTTERIYRLPAGIKSDAWQITLIGNTPIYSFTMAENAKELQQA